ncbi:lys-63-specific deubiquitinase BRCC36 [Tribolium castaneum]|uniref:lys-63-specific deubiquitinase BRCC36 n=1 Tax=Tribolium castaneum TaxID=7070 RepID=UPI0000D571EF
MISDEKYLKKVVLSSDVYTACFQHALTTEKEEVMGLLIGEVNEQSCISYISACVILHRSDKQPDRVEISPEQLCTASGYAEELASKLHRPMRVLGWYHSHPHITVWPSHLDVRTQLMYQTMDPLFVGLIFSVYQNESGAGATDNHVQLTCFQACKRGAECQRREVELEIVDNEFYKNNLESISSLSRILTQEEVQRHEGQGDYIEDELTMLHNNALQTLALVQIVSKVTKPLCEDIEAKLQTTNSKIQELEKINKQLTDQVTNFY